MRLQAGASLLHYRVVDKVGEGGMGEVWRARDTTLDRDVAIKVLPPMFTNEQDRLTRFEREAKLLASLNHPHIAAIHGLHEHGGLRFLAMELVPGEDLAARLARGPVALDEALSCATKIAEALEYAHEHGIVHRDLKPANIKVTADGGVKVLDFGLAKAMDPTTSEAAATMTSPAMTQAGLILGTAAYMSPEQARGRPVDKRADNWAFGCVLYEMLTGRRLFDGETVTDVLAAVVTREPDWSHLPPSTPAAVRRLMARCLDKDPRTRLRDVGEARIVLASPDAAEPAPALPVSTSAAGLARWSIAVAALALAAGLAIGRYVIAPAPPAARVFEFDVTVPGSAMESGSFALSPDGSRLALVVRSASGERQLAIRDMDSGLARVLPGTDGALYPFWSPDGRELGFFAGGRLSRITIDGAAARLIAAVADPRGGTWGASDMILVGSGIGPIQKVPASGGRAPEPVTALEPNVEIAHAWPTFLPDGARFIFMSDGGSDASHRIWLGNVNGGPTTVLRQAVRSGPVVDPAGRLLLSERGQLLAYPFNVYDATLGDEPTVIATDVHALGNQHQLSASAAPGGMVAFQHSSPDSQLVILDLAGSVTRTVGQPDRFGNISVSPDGSRVAFEIDTDASERLIWVQDIERGVRTAMSMRGKLSDSSAWSPDGEYVYFDSETSGLWEAYRKALTGGGEPERLGKPDAVTEAAVADVSPDGRWLLCSTVATATRGDIYVRSLDETGAWTPWIVGPAYEQAGDFSPDSRWIAYTSDVSGRVEVYVAPLEGGPAAAQWQMSSAGGSEPKFSPDGRTLYYRSAAFQWMAVSVRLMPGKVEAGVPKALFAMPPLELPYLRNLMDVMPDGSGFLTIHPVSTSALSIRVRTGK